LARERGRVLSSFEGLVCLGELVLRKTLEVFARTWSAWVDGIMIARLHDCTIARVWRM